jgi:hypothetical protein
MGKPPILIKQFFTPTQVKDLNEVCAGLKAQNGEHNFDSTFNRHHFNNIPFFVDLHHGLLTILAQKIFQEKLKPSYSFVSFYAQGKGICNAHVDQPRCYKTIDVCLNQNYPWTLWVNHQDKIVTGEENQDILARVKQGSVPYTLEKGDALCYSGVDHAHWRAQIRPDNFCDLVFFHFVSPDFPLDPLP